MSFLGSHLIYHQSPPFRNTGVRRKVGTEVNTINFVDWISATIPMPASSVTISDATYTGRVLSLAYELTGEHTWTATRPRFGYALAWASDVGGAIIQCNPSRADMEVNFVAPGAFLTTHPWRAMIARLERYQARFSRLDMTVQFACRHPLTSELYDLASAQQWVSSARKFQLVSSNTGSTLYVGGRTSEKFLRVYDKGAQLGEEPGTLWRVELECKGSVARQYAKWINGEASPQFAHVIRQFADWPDSYAWLLAMRTSKDAPAFTTEKRSHSTRAWLFGIVADCMARLETANPGTLEQFNAHVRSLNDKLPF